MNADDDLKKRVEALERENRALRTAMERPAKANVVIVTEGSYQGHPTMTFEAGGRPFTLGLRKLAVVLHCAEHVKRFVSGHKAEIKDWEIVRGSDGADRGGRDDMKI